MKTRFAPSLSPRNTGLSLGIAVAALMAALPPAFAQNREAPHSAGPPSRSAPAFRPAPAPRSAPVDRSSHGSIRHSDTHIVQRPVEVRREPVHPIEDRREPARPIEGRRPFEPRHEIIRRGDVDVDFHRRRFWHDFAFGRRHGELPLGFLAFNLGAVPYYYYDGIYYRPVDGGYQEVYPPLGAAIPEPPDGAIEIDAGGQVYYYAGGAFYVQQPDGTFVIAPAPMGVVVPELPPGAIQVSVNGVLAYQFNGIYYEPVFVAGVTQYQTFMP